MNSNGAPLTGFAPIIVPRARLMILGSFPGVASLGAQRYYAHPRNQFWPIVGALCGEDLVGKGYDERLDALRRHGIALWDVIEQCERRGSLDSAITNAVGNAFDAVLEQMPELEMIAFNGGTAARMQSWFEARGYRTMRMPSTSPAYAAMRAADKLASWSALRPWIVRPPVAD